MRQGRNNNYSKTRNNHPPIHYRAADHIDPAHDHIRRAYDHLLSTDDHVIHFDDRIHNHNIHSAAAVSRL
jgi:hypothetical protein